MKESQMIIFMWAILAFTLLIIIIYWTTYITKNHIHVCESFLTLTNATNGPNYSHTVDLPINTTLSCKNMCGSLGRCYLTGEQCTSDVDCFGCQTSQNPKMLSIELLRGQNDAGKETTGVTPTYSVLTTDIGTNAKLYNKLNIDPPQYDIGVNTWRKKYDDGQKFFDMRYSHGQLDYMPTYPKRKTLSGQFDDDGPLASNAYLSS